MKKFIYLLVLLVLIGCTKSLTISTQPCNCQEYIERLDSLESELKRLQEVVVVEDKWIIIGHHKFRK